MVTICAVIDCTKGLDYTRSRACRHASTESVSRELICNKQATGSVTRKRPAFVWQRPLDTSTCKTPGAGSMTMQTRVQDSCQLAGKTPWQAP